MTTSIIIADDHPLMLHGINDFLESKGFNIIGSAAVEEIETRIAHVEMAEPYFSEAISLHLNKALPLNNSSILNGLTKSEKKIAHLITENKTSQQRADELNVAIKTIHKHRSNMYLSSN